MASLRPSAFNQRERADGGPFLVVESAEKEEDGGVYVFFTDVPAEQHTLDSPKELLLYVTPDEMTIWPLNVRQDRDDYLLPKYDTLKRIIICRRKVGPYQLPTTTDEVVELLEELPDGFAKDFRFGLGLLWEYRQICETVAEIEGVSTLVIHGGNDAKLDPPLYILGERRFHELRKELNRIASRYQRDARRDKQFSTYHTLLHAADPAQFPVQNKKLRPDAIAEMTNGGRDHAVLSKRDRRAAIRMVQDSVAAMAETDAHTLLALKSDIELVTLKQLINRYQEMLEGGLAESKWQNFFLANPFILNLAFAIPAMVVQGQAYAGGKRLNGSGGKVTDFLCASVSTGNLALIEIKKPDTELLGRTPYRGDDIYGPSTDLGGAIAQVLDQRFRLQSELPVMKNAMNRYDIHSFAVRCIIIAGVTPQEHQQKKSFELVRNALSDVVVITFDELLTRLTELQKAFQLPDFEETVPF
ncbi:DUF4263 domain-containing protein [Chromobacterium phragmitis]|uniref:Shedu immune nuclease family protein n=1 Tax=Chromobacterium phragmitis TaxID=2202141 RepID=UPI000DECEA43|nr:Shedu immune nuclease family protein [Chromobacterium phragmitis]AXE29736.1 DUF4263 domain-containing protein [Chromobacterium phragmitis]